MNDTNHRRTRGRLSRAFAWVAALGLLGPAAQANATAEAAVQRERAALEARVEAVRAALHDPADAPSRLVAQWNNWKNWSNWNNWKNWVNWLNK